MRYNYRYPEPGLLMMRIQSYGGEDGGRNSRGKSSHYCGYASSVLITAQQGLSEPEDPGWGELAWHSSLLD